MTRALNVVSQLCREQPNLHGDIGRHQWGLAAEVLRWIARHVNEGDATLETGCGYSTLVFAAAGCRHTVISPSEIEHARIREWGEQNGIDFAQVAFVAERSEKVLPSLKTPPLSVALIDGWHGFPGPFIDWFFIAQLMSVGGFLIVDDVHIRACAILRDFLQTERGRWESCGQIYRTAMFRKLTDELFAGDWNTQPFNATPRLSAGERLYRSVCSPMIRVARTIPGMSSVIDRARPLFWGR
jgi:hypothetical protein